MNLPMLSRSRRAVAIGAGLLALVVGGLAAAPAPGARPSGRSYPSVGADPLPPADPRTVPGYGADPVSLLGPSRLSAAQMAASVRMHRAPRITVSIEQLAEIYIQEAAAYGVRADLAWTQSIVETGWFTFPDGGLVRPTDNNFAGMGACDSCSDGNRYADARTGVRAQMALLRGYADPTEVPDAIHRPPTSLRGIAPTWMQMGNGRWATSTRYASTVLGVYLRLLAEHDLTLAYEPPIHSDPEPVVPVRQGDGLYLAGIDGAIYDIGDARSWGSPANRLRSPVAAVVPAPGALGYWVITARGGVWSYGDAAVTGTGLDRMQARVADAAATPAGTGFWIVSRAGEVLAFGDAAPIAPAPDSLDPTVSIAGIAPTATGSGYWLVDERGHVTAVGDAADFGSLPAASASDPIVGIAARPSGDGYWLATSKGRVFAFGAARRHGGLFAEFDAQLDVFDFETYEDLKAQARRLARSHPVVSIAPTPTGEGYWLVTADGWIVGRGDGADFGDVSPTGEAIVAGSARRT